MRQAASSSARQQSRAMVEAIVSTADEPTSRRADVRVLSCVERGWRGAREASLVLAERGVAVTHLIKGRLPEEVRAVIAPHPGIRLIDLPRQLFRPALWLLLPAAAVGGGLRWVLVDNDRMERELSRWCRWLRLGLVRVHERIDGYELRLGGRAVSAAELADRAAGR